MGEFTKFLENSFPGKPVFTGAYAVQQHLVRVSSDKDDTMELSEAQGIPLFGFCGIGKPESFQATLRESGLELAGFQPFQDHHAYTEDDIRSLYEQSRSAGTGTLVTTEKDLVKVRGLLPRNAELLVLPVSLQMDESFDRFLMDRLEITG